MISKPFEEWSKGGSKDLSSRHQRKRDCEGQRPFTWGAGELAGSKIHAPHFSLSFSTRLRRVEKESAIAVLKCRCVDSTGIGVSLLLAMWTSCESSLFYTEGAERLAWWVGSWDVGLLADGRDATAVSLCSLKV